MLHSECHQRLAQVRAAPRGQRFGLGLVQVSASAASVPRSPRHLFPLLKGLYSGPLKGAYTDRLTDGRRQR